MWVQIAVRTAQKTGNDPGEYEDAYWPHSGADVRAWYFRAAIADGATETSFAKQWAAELVNAYGRRRLEQHNLPFTLTAAQRRWAASTSSQPLPWYAEEKLGLGAFSTLVGLTVFDGGSRDDPPAEYGPTPNHPPGKTWRALAVGDSCLFQVRAGKVLVSFPLEQSRQFSNHPALIASLCAANSQLHNITKTASGDWQAGDRFLLLTDAVALWLVRSMEACEDGLTTLDSAMTDDSAFARWLADTRTKGDMRNDDVTVLSLTIRDNEP